MSQLKKGQIGVDFIGIGVPKAATSWLYFCLKEHQAICMPEKEIQFFNDLQPFEDEEMLDNYAKGLEGYQDFFSDCSKQKTIGEFSVNYFAAPKAAERIHTTFPDVKLILILRNPVDRAYSHYQYKKAKGRNFGASQKAQEMDFMDFLQSEENFKRIGFYDQHLQRWLSFFDMEQLLIWRYADIQRRPEEVVQETYAFLSVSESFTPSVLEEKVNTAKEKGRLSFGNPIMSSLARVCYGIYDTIFPPQKGYPELNQETREKVLQIYLPHIKNAESLTQKDLSIWYAK